MGTLYIDPNESLLRLRAKDEVVNNLRSEIGTNGETGDAERPNNSIHAACSTGAYRRYYW